MHLMVGSLVDGVPGDDDDVISRKDPAFQIPVRLLHESPCFISLNTLAYFFACKKSSSGVIQVIFPMKNHYVLVSERLSFVIDLREIFLTAQNLRS